MQSFPLFDWVLGELGLASWREARDLLDDPAFEERAADGSSRFLQVLLARGARGKITEAELARYDSAIVADWDAVVKNRVYSWGRPRLKYFQYLCLLAVEHLLTRRRDDEHGLLVTLNASGKWQYGREDFTRIAVSIATGAGKTLLMHANLKQWMRIVGVGTVDSVILVTPSEALSRQHFDEMRLSGIGATLFDPDFITLFDNDLQVKIIDINKLRETQGTKTVAVESFGTRNLVLIDEAHRGSRSEDRVWKEFRDRLSRDGFAFEYSATFRQAVAASGDMVLVEEYEKAIIFDYPYREFYNDGFGKEFRVRNADFKDDDEEAALYFVAALLMFFQQKVAFARDQAAARESSIASPLLLAVGTTVQKADSDVETLLLRLRDFIEHRSVAVSRIRELLENGSALVSNDGQPVVFNDLDLLREAFANAETLYEGMRLAIFNAGAGGAMRIMRFTAAQGEIRVSVDTCKPFALINVGDSAALFNRITGTLGLAGDEDTGTSSDAMFHSLSKDDSPVNVLIGARKFLEGWDSDRPSCMLLLNVGRGEGTQIIQLFGRGVRLKGFQGSLTRSSQDLYRPPAPRGLHLLETLEIFGIRADYIKRFRSVLEIEGISNTFDATRTLKTSLSIPKSPRLKILRAEGVAFPEAYTEVFFEPHADQIRVTLDWYPRVLSYASLSAIGDAIERRTAVLGPEILCFVDLDRVYAAMLAYKRSRRWSNLVISRLMVDRLFATSDWYTLYASPQAMHPSDISSIRSWQGISESLACAYLSEWYRLRLREHEAKRLKVRDLNPDDPAVVKEYVAHYDGTDSRTDEVLKGSPRRSGDAVEIIQIGQSVYSPFLYVADRDACATVPVALVKSERDFVSDLIRYIREGGLSGANAVLYLLRNASRGRGMGFAEAENFYPDFVLWFCRGDAQVAMFVEPHGLAYEVDGFESPKVAFSKTVLTIEKRLGDPGLKLAAAIVSPTPRAKLKWACDAQQSELEEHNVFFLEDVDYIGRLMRKGLNRLEEFSPRAAKG